MFLIRLVALVSLLYLPTLGAVAADACTAPEAALAYLLDRQEDIDELRAGGQGPLRIAYLHTPQRYPPKRPDRPRRGNRHRTALSPGRQRWQGVPGHRPPNRRLAPRLGARLGRPGLARGDPHRPLTSRGPGTSSEPLRTRSETASLSAAMTTAPARDAPSRGTTHDPDAAATLPSLVWSIRRGGRTIAESDPTQTDHDACLAALRAAPGCQGDIYLVTSLEWSESLKRETWTAQPQPRQPRAHRPRVHHGRRNDRHHPRALHRVERESIRRAAAIPGTGQGVSLIQLADRPSREHPRPGRRPALRRRASTAEPRSYRLSQHRARIERSRSHAVSPTG